MVTLTLLRRDAEDEPEGEVIVRLEGAIVLLSEEADPLEQCFGPRPGLLQPSGQLGVLPFELERPFWRGAMFGRLLVDRFEPRFRGQRPAPVAPQLIPEVPDEPVQIG